MKTYYDVVTIGAGPAGAVAAFAAARKNLSVLLLDRAAFPRFKVCGCCLSARALNTLDRIGLGAAVRGLGGRPLSRLNLRAQGSSASLPLSGGVGISRSRLDAMLVEQAQHAGVTFVDRTSAALGPLRGRARCVELRSRDGRQKRVEAGVVLVADGLAGTALRGHANLTAQVAAGSRLGAGTVVDRAAGYEDGVVTLACTRSGYAGTVALQDGRLEIAAALDPHYMLEMGGPGPAVGRLLHDVDLPSIPGLVESDWRGTPPLTRQRLCVAGERYFVLGDAAGYVEPFTGEGIAWAIEGAIEASRCLPQAHEPWRGELESAWNRSHRALVRRRQWSCRAIAALLRRPTVTKLSIGLLGRAPTLARPLVRRLTQPLQD